MITPIQPPAGIAAPIVRELTVDEIGWALGASPSLVADTSEPDGADLLVELVLDAQAYRLLAQQAIHALHRLQAQHDQLRAVHYALVAEHRGIGQRDAA